MSGILMKQVCKPFSPYEKVEITVEVLDKICNLSVHKELARELREKTRIRKFISFASISVNSRAKLLRMPLKNLPHFACNCDLISRDAAFEEIGEFLHVL